MDIHTVTVEFLRAGPRHNQLLSPLTQYLAVCGDSPAGIVNVPFEQAVFERQRDDLRYAVTAEENTSERRQGVLDETGIQMARMLAAVPGLPGALNSQSNLSEILHLRVVISASELASLPFELSKLPVAGGSATAEWLQIRASQPVCITRHNRSVASEKVKWPTRPRILYIYGPDVPAVDHENALANLLHPWTDNGEKLSDWLTVCKEPTIEQIAAAVAKQEFTHVHILAHGAKFEGNHGRFGVSLNNDSVVSGRQLALALTKVRDRIHMPTVVTMATCDSAQETNPAYPGASVAHDLHEAGIPFVVASQFPLSVKGALPFVEKFYYDQLRGIHPLLSIYRIRLDLYAENEGKYHDWASLIVYEALPSNIADQLLELQYAQSKRALEGSLGRLENAWDKGLDCDYLQMDQELENARGQLPKDGPYEAECLGLRAASWKRRAQVEFRRALADPRKESEYANSCYSCLERALTDYQTGTDSFLLMGEKSMQRVATLHWLLSQVMSLECVLGKPFRLRPWMAAVFSVEAELSCSDAGSKWGHGTIAELYLIRLGDEKLKSSARKELAAKAMWHGRRIVQLNPLMSDQVKSARRQFQRYIDWWSDGAFVNMLEAFKVPSKPHWHEPDGLIETAKRVVEILGGGMPFAEAKTPAAKPKTAPVQVSVTPTRAAARAVAGGIFDIEMIPAENGDCLWVEYGDPTSPHRIIIDCGAKSAANLLSAKISQLAKSSRNFDLFVLTHIDSDHISGVPAFFTKLPPGTSFDEIWFNGWKQMPKDKLGVKQGEEFSRILEAPEQMPRWNRSFGSTEGIPFGIEVDGRGPRSFTLDGGMTVTVLSPGHAQLQKLAANWLEGLKELHPDDASYLGRSGHPPEPIQDFEKFDLETLAALATPPDPSVANGSSIALLLEYGGAAALLTGDAYPQVVSKSIRALMESRGAPGVKLRLDALKLAHHGSKNGLSQELLAAIDCHTYLISTNGTKFYHPDRESIAKVILHSGPKPTLCFNYVSDYNKIWGNSILTKRYGYNTVYPPGKNPGLRVSLAKKRPAKAKSARV